MDATGDQSDTDLAISIQQLAINGTKFIDADFPTTTFTWNSLKSAKIMWKRPEQLCASPCLFDEVIDASYVRQGRIGDCFFIAALSLLCSEPDAIKKIVMGISKIQETGSYTFQFFEYGQWKRVTIDDRIPARVLRNGKAFRLVLGRSARSNVFWVSLIEKAYAKFYGSYDRIRGGNISEALSDLTGAPVNDYSLEAPSFKPKLFWTRLAVEQKSGALIGCACCQSDISDSDHENDAGSTSGIQPNHAYSVQDVVETEFDGKRRKLLLVKDPQRDGQRMEFRGAFTNASSWSEQARRALPATPLHPGLFWMTWNEFRWEFNRIYICHYQLLKSCQITSVFGSWTEQTAGGCTDYASWKWNPAFHMSGRIIAISLQQPDRRRRVKQDAADAISYPMIGLTIVKRAADIDNPFLMDTAGDVLGRTSFWNKRDVAIDVSDQWPTPFVVVPSYHEPHLTGDFVLNIYSMGDVTVRKGQTQFKQVSCRGRWTKSSSGGGPLSATFPMNPKFLLDVDRTNRGSAPGAIVLFIGLQQLHVPKANRHKVGICLLRKAVSATEALEGLHGSLDGSWFIGKASFEVMEEVNRTVEISTEQLPVLVVPCSWEQGRVADFNLTIYSRTDTPIITQIEADHA